jgi:hypothetical protein
VLLRVATPSPLQLHSGMVIALWVVGMSAPSSIIVSAERLDLWNELQPVAACSSQSIPPVEVSTSISCAGMTTSISYVKDSVSNLEASVVSHAFLASEPSRHREGSRRVGVSCLRELGSLWERIWHKVRAIGASSSDIIGDSKYAGEQEDNAYAAASERSFLL